MSHLWEGEVEPLHNSDPLTRAVNEIERRPSRPSIAHNVLAYGEAEHLLGGTSRGLRRAIAEIDKLEVDAREIDNDIVAVISANAYAHASEHLQSELWHWLNWERGVDDPKPTPNANAVIGWGLAAFFVVIALMVA